MNDTHTLPNNQENLSNAVHEAELLRAYASSRGIHLDEGVLATIVQGKHLLQPDPLDKDRDAKEMAFWKARSALAQAVLPVSAESLKQCVLPSPAPTWRSAWLARWFGGQAVNSTGVESSSRKMQKSIFIPVFILLLVQMYALIGQSVVADLVPRMEKMHEYLSERQKLVLAEKVEGSKQALETVDQQIALNQIEIEIRVAMLDKWNGGWGWLATPFILLTPIHPALVGKTDPAENSTRHQQFRAMVLQAEFALKVLQNFILPLLYGCLGAALYVLRALATDAKEYTFDTERRIGYNLRIDKGTLCGLVIGWFVPDSKVHDAGLPQYALSILGGYSVDIVFGLMDKIIKSLSSSGCDCSRKSGGGEAKAT